MTEPTTTPTASFQAYRLVVFWGFHLVTLGLVAWVGVSWGAVAFCAGAYVVRMFGVTAGYHRYFSHRSFKTSRPVQFALGVLASSSLQKGVLWWAGNHRLHHRYSDQPQDVHSPRQRGLAWAHVGWISSTEFDAVPEQQIKDFAQYPELRWLERNYVWAFVVACAVVLATLGPQYLIWGCFVSTLCLWHGTFLINSAAHVWGKQIYETGDDSRNSWILALLTLGEGWHNNHHFYQACAHQGFTWWQLDVTYLAIVVLEKLGLVWDVKRAPQRVIDGWRGGRYLRLDRPEPTPEPELTQAAA